MEDSEYQRRFFQKQLDRIHKGLGNYAWTLKFMIDVLIFSALVYNVMLMRNLPVLECPSTQEIYKSVNWTSFNHTISDISKIESCVCT